MSAEKQPLSFPIEELYHDDGYKLIILSCILSILCISVVVARFFAVRLKKANLWWDDWLCIPALIMALGLNAINITLVKKAGVGRHVASFGPEAPLKVMMWAKIVYAELLIYAFAVPLPKLVLLLFYVRIFSNKVFKRVAYAVALFVTVWCPIVFFLDMFQCSPIKSAWDKKVPSGGKCINTLAFFQYISIPIVISDVALLIMPLPMIWQLQTNRNQKIALSGVFLMGSIGLIASIIRMVEFFQSGDALADPTWAATPLLAWTMVEVEAVLIAACLPPLRPLFLNFWQASTNFGSRFSSRIPRGTRTGRTHGSTASMSYSNVGLAGAGPGGPPISAGDKQGFVRIEEEGGIRRTWELEMKTMDATPPTPPRKGARSPNDVYAGPGFGV